MKASEELASGFRYRDGQLYLAKMSTPLAFAWSWPDIDVASIDPATVTMSKDPCGRWHVSFAVDMTEPEQLPATGRTAGVDLGIRDFAVTSDEEKLANPRGLARRERNLARYRRRMARCQKGSVNRAKAISDCGWGTFRQMLEYKAANAGRHLITAGCGRA